MNALEPSHNTPHSASYTAPTPAAHDDPPSPLRAALVENKQRLLCALRNAGVHCATIVYCGCGDSGTVDQVHLTTANGGTPDISRHVVAYLHCNASFVRGEWACKSRTSDLRLDDALRVFANDALSLHHDGYETGDGGSGEVIFACDTGGVRLEHRNYYTESDCTDTDL